MNIIPKISILVPVYKVEAYLQRCIDSVLAQDFTDWEMILVDDGSPDRCPQICDEAAEKDGRIRVVHKENGGLVSARKAGWLQAKGEYVMHLDSDDYLFDGALRALYDKAVEGNYDVVKGCHRCLLSDGTFIDVRTEWSNKEIIGCENYLREYVSGHLQPYLWGGLYRRSLFCEAVFDYAMNVSVGEDFITNLALWRGVNRFCSIGTFVCAYFINADSMMQSKVLSHEYHEWVNGKKLQLTADAPQDVRCIIERGSWTNHIRCFFMPEIGWSNDWYERVREYIQQGDNLRQIRQSSDSKFTRFIKWRWLFKIYSRCYRWLFLRYKLKSKKRKVIKKIDEPNTLPLISLITVNYNNIGGGKKDY